MKVRWTRAALEHLRRHRDWLAGIEGADPARTAKRIRASVRKLETLGDIGRPSSVAPARELSVTGAPYVVVYRVELDHFVIVAVFHMAERR